jgi:hypothetical protein
MVIRYNAMAGRYNRAIAAMKDTSTLITAPVPHPVNAELHLAQEGRSESSHPVILSEAA